MMSELIQILRNDDQEGALCHMRLSQDVLDEAIPQSILLHAHNCSRVLIDMGANIFRLHECKTMLQLAVEQEDVNLVMQLLKRGLDPNQYVDKPLLYMAVENNNIPMVQNLCQGGAYPLQTYNGVMVMEFARRKGNPSILQVMERALGRASTPTFAQPQAPSQPQAHAESRCARVEDLLENDRNALWYNDVCAQRAQ